MNEMILANEDGGRRFRDARRLSLARASAALLSLTRRGLLASLLLLLLATLLLLLLVARHDVFPLQVDECAVSRDKSVSHPCATDATSTVRPGLFGFA